MQAVDPTSSPYFKIVVVLILLALVLFLGVGKLASQYFLVDTGFSRAMSIGADGDGGAHVSEIEEEICVTCGHSGSKKCSGCKRVRYCSQQCQTKHWRADHRFKCKQMRLLQNVEISHSRKLTNEVLFPYDEFLKLFNWEYDEVSPCGLVNLGNSCFANVVLQCLTFTRPLVAYLLGKNHTRGCVRKMEEWCFLCELQAHVQRARESLNPISPTRILSRLPNIGGNFGYGQQEDAHEFMRFAIDKMQSACLDEFGGEKNLDLSSQETTIIQHIFGGHLRSQVICEKCKMVSNRYDNMMDLTVEIQGDAESLEQCLNQFTAGEWLDGDNKYKCDGCKDYVKAWKRLTVHQPPNILTIALKRFQSGRFGKLNKKITFPMRLDLTPYTSAGIGVGSDWYDLYAVVVHLDMLNASFFGHYICYIKDHQDRWYRVDDCKVVVVEPEEVLAQGAYMLLYTRVNPRPGPLTTPKDPPSEQRLQMAIPPSPTNLVGHTENETLSYPNGGTHQHDVLAGVKGPVETELDVSTMGKNKSYDLAPASPLREETLFLSPTHSASPKLGSCTEPKETENDTSSRSTNQCLENGFVVKSPREMFSRGFLDKPCHLKPLEKNRRARLPGIDQKPDLNINFISGRLCNGHLPNGDALTNRNGQTELVHMPFSNGESSIKEDSSSSTGGCSGSDMDHSSFSMSNWSLKEGEVSSMDVSNSDLNGEVSNSNGYSALEFDKKNEDGINHEMHEMASSHEDIQTQNGLRQRVVHSQPVFKAAEQNGVAEL
ncbi:ubiquitin carboxyl-terminal hydrolase 18-like protein [Carex littledalei]|uniref:Ubiquitin carboxyl-terminal hydrolase 18-like protein n=1 Tax=Carex littledalei TaxID=544730 RepID=A0A833QND0_9POAL|nr:ubiquitin carboxyl-terminal hydrolase 18-like protein [Carex littledalei]